MVGHAHELSRARRVSDLTSGVRDRAVPHGHDTPAGADGEWAGLDALACDGTWPTVDQRGLRRPKVAAEACDVGAEEREVLPAEDPTEEDADEDAEDDTAVPDGERGSGSDDGTAGPVPTSVPAGGGRCADGCP